VSVLDIRVAGSAGTPGTLALPVRAGNRDGAGAGTAGLLVDPPESVAAEVLAFLADVERPGRAGAIHRLPRPGREPADVLLVGVGEADEAGWRSAGAALARASRLDTVGLPLPPADAPLAAGGLAEGAWLASYRFRLAADADGDTERRRLRRLTLTAPVHRDAADAVGRARAVAEAVIFARDLTNTPSLQKSPKWLADRVVQAAARRSGLTARVFDPGELDAAGFGGILAVGAGSARPPRLVELSWRPRAPRRHVVLVGKGITFDSGGISMKNADGMKLMRKDMGGAAAVCAATLAAADLALPVRVTALAPLAENLVSGSATRPGDLVRHYGGLTTEVQNTDAEGRVVLGDGLAYAARRLKPDVLVDLATLTGASHVALGKRTAALFTHDDDLAGALSEAGAGVGEPMWRMPLPEEYVALLASDVADLNNAPAPGQAGAITAALYLREFTGDLREKWAHIDMSAPSWSDRNDGPLVKGATGWGVRMLIRWLATVA
jgi:leucyl aminopeptidase